MNPAVTPHLGLLHYIAQQPTRASRHRFLRALGCVCAYYREQPSRSIPSCRPLRPLRRSSPPSVSWRRRWCPLRSVFDPSPRVVVHCFRHRVVHADAPCAICPLQTVDAGGVFSKLTNVALYTGAHKVNPTCALPVAPPASFICSRHWLRRSSFFPPVANDCGSTFACLCLLAGALRRVWSWIGAGGTRWRSPRPDQQSRRPVADHANQPEPLVSFGPVFPRTIWLPLVAVSSHVSRVLCEKNQSGCSSLPRSRSMHGVPCVHNKG